MSSDQLSIVNGRGTELRAGLLRSREVGRVVRAMLVAFSIAGLVALINGYVYGDTAAVFVSATGLTRQQHRRR